MAGWTGPNCTEGEFALLREVILYDTGEEEVMPECLCQFFSQNAQLGFMEHTVSSCACVRMELRATKLMESAHVQLDGWVWPVNWVGNALPHQSAIRNKY